jgi:DNA-directed RNA polymerase specialized sigma24 family protein
MEDFNPLSIASLILRIQRRTVNNTSAASALAELYDLLGGRLYSLALFILGDEPAACQVTQSSFLHLWNHPNLYESAPKLLLTQKTFFAASPTRTCAKPKPNPANY